MPMFLVFHKAREVSPIYSTRIHNIKWVNIICCISVFIYWCHQVPNTIPLPPYRCPFIRRTLHNRWNNPHPKYLYHSRLLACINDVCVLTSMDMRHGGSFTGHILPSAHCNIFLVVWKSSLMFYSHVCTVELLKIQCHELVRWTKIH